MNDLKTRAMKALFDRYMRWRIDDLAHPQSVVVLEYPIHPRPRYGEGRPAHPELEALLARNDDVYGAMLAAFARLAPPLAVIAEEADAGHPASRTGRTRIFRRSMRLRCTASWRR